MKPNYKLFITVCGLLRPPVELKHGLGSITRLLLLWRPCIGNICSRPKRHLPFEVVQSCFEQYHSDVFVDKLQKS